MLDGIETEIIGAVLVGTAVYLWNRLLRDVFHNLFKGEAKKLNGHWIATHDDGTKDSVILKQFGSMVWGEILVRVGEEKNKKYDFKGSYRYPFLAIDFRAAKNDHFVEEDGGSIFLRVQDKGDNLEGGMTSFDGDHVQIWKSTWVRKN